LVTNCWKERKKKKERKRQEEYRKGRKQERRKSEKEKRFRLERSAIWLISHGLNFTFVRRSIFSGNENFIQRFST
jgi:hypothetical protein